MKRWISILFLCSLYSGLAQAQSLTVQVGFPSIRWEVRPLMVEIAPAMWVVEDSPYEVFYYDGWYWTRQDDRWYRSSDHYGHWREADRASIPVRFYHNHPGHYRHYRDQSRPAVMHARPANQRPVVIVRPGDRHENPGRGGEKRDHKRGKPAKGHQKKGGKH